MEIYLIRHTTPEIEKGICYGQSDLPLATSFQTELQELLKQHPSLNNPHTIYSSPLQRCKLLAEELHSTAIQYDVRLQELNFGDWELQPWDDIDQNQLKPWMEDFVNSPCPNGESFIDLYQRVLSFKDDLLLTQNENVIIITHAGVIRSFLSYVNNTPLNEAFEYKVAYGEVIQLNIPTNKRE